jgi:hypothetical protein
MVSSWTRIAKLVSLLGSKYIGGSFVSQTFLKHLLQILPIAHLQQLFELISERIASQPHYCKFLKFCHFLREFCEFIIL